MEQQQQQQQQEQQQEQQQQQQQQPQQQTALAHIDLDDPALQAFVAERVRQNRELLSKGAERDDSRQIATVKAVHADLSDDEIRLALSEAGNEDDAVLFLLDDDNRTRIRDAVTAKKRSNGGQRAQNAADSSAQPTVASPRRSPRRSPRASSSSGGADAGALDGAGIKERQRQRLAAELAASKQGEHNGVTIVVPEKIEEPEKFAGKPHSADRSLRLDEALAKGSTEGWSLARINAFTRREENPNAYYYRFNDPGEAQRNGKWSKEEEDLFFARMDAVGVDGQWGVFSQAIPGRVGYQCSNFYRTLLKSGRVKSEQYYEQDGRLHHVNRGPR
jgi:hypothetical protein